MNLPSGALPAVAGTTVSIQSPSVLLIGGPGSGKTYSLSTLAKAGLEVFVVVTEPTGLDSLLDAWVSNKHPIEKLHWRAITPARAGVSQLMDMAKKVSVMDFEALAKLKPTAGRGNAKWMDLLKCLSDFTCDRTGQSYGPVDSFGPDRALVIDSLSGLNIMAMDLVIGDKPSAHQGEWGIAMTMLERLLQTLTSETKCAFVLTSHAERETNDMTGAIQVMASALGRKLAPRLPRFFSEVVMSYREGEQFFWSTATVGADLKRRSLPLSSKIDPSFVPIIEAYRRRLAAASGK